MAGFTILVGRGVAVEVIVAGGPVMDEVSLMRVAEVEGWVDWVWVDGVGREGGGGCRRAEEEGGKGWGHEVERLELQFLEELHCAFPWCHT